MLCIIWSNERIYGDNIPSTVVDRTTGDFEIIREGKGELEGYL